LVDKAACFGVASEVENWVKGADFTKVKVGDGHERGVEYKLLGVAYWDEFSLAEIGGYGGVLVKNVS